MNNCVTPSLLLQDDRLGEFKGPIRQVCGDKVADNCKEIWGLNEEGELNGCWRDLGFHGLWYMMGLFNPLCLLES